MSTYILQRWKWATLPLHLRKSSLVEQREQIWQARLEVSVQQQAVCWAKQIDEQHSPPGFEDAVHFDNTSSLVTLMNWWLETGMTWSPERVDALFRDLVLPGVSNLLHQET